MELQAKLDRLRERLREVGSLVVAYSGGTDSTFLLKIATETLGRESTLGVTARSPSYPEEEFTLAERLAREHGFNHLVVETRETDDPNYASNPPERCYFCKRALYEKLFALARERGFKYVASGANADDVSDWRPGARAEREMGVIRPLQEVGLTKQEIRELSRAAGLENWKKPAQACLASRLPYGTAITPERLRQIELAEAFLRTRVGLDQCRVRWHDQVARIECAPEQIERVIARRREITDHLRSLGFLYVALDLQGYRTGSLNEMLPPSTKSRGRR